MKVGVVVATILVVGMVLGIAERGEGISCQLVDNMLAPCVSYLIRGGNPPVGCCTGIRQLKFVTRTTANRRAACGCIKQSAGRYKDIKPDAASNLPRLCGVTVGFPITKDINCNNIP